MLELQIYCVSPDLIDELHKSGSIDRASIFEKQPTGVMDHSGYVLLRADGDPKKSALGVLLGDHVQRVVDKDLVFSSVKPRDKQQVCFMWGLQNLHLNVALGGAGTGKTTLAIAYAVHKLLKEDFTVVLSKPTRLVGGPSDAWGTLPGGVEEKMQPYLESFLIPLRKVLGDTTQMYVDKWINTGKLIIQPLETIRGMSFENCVVILDECQNCTPHELLSFISRVAADSKCILLGDPAQIDIDCPWRDTGIALLLNSEAFYYSELAKGIKFTAQYRGPLAQLAAEVLEELNGEVDED